jgi:uncharacterized membrane protein
MQATSNTVGVVSMQRVTMGIYIIVPFLLHRGTFTAAQFVSMQRVTMCIYIIMPFPFT